jgi:diguanylate cyclase (GGDEF)-like protein
MLRHVAQTVARLLRRSDLLARYGGEEFAALLLGADRDAAARVAETLRNAIENEPLPDAPASPPPRATISLGVASLPENGQHEAEVLEAADRALYRAKREGRNRVCVAEPVPA